MQDSTQLWGGRDVSDGLLLDLVSKSMDIHAVHTNILIIEVFSEI